MSFDDSMCGDVTDNVILDLETKMAELDATFPVASSEI